MVNAHYIKIKQVITILFYDFEVYQYWWCVVIADTDTQKFEVIETQEELQGITMTINMIYGVVITVKVMINIFSKVFY